MTLATPQYIHQDYLTLPLSHTSLNNESPPLLKQNTSKLISTYKLVILLFLDKFLISLSLH